MSRCSEYVQLTLRLSRRTEDARGASKLVGLSLAGQVDQESTTVSRWTTLKWSLVMPTGVGGVSC